METPPRRWTPSSRGSISREDYWLRSFYKTMKLPHWAGPDALWRREPLPPERDDGEKLDLVNAHIASSRHGLAPGAGLRGLLSG